MTDAAPCIGIRNLSKRFGSVNAVNNISLDIRQGELFAILGGSGCGKTTLLRMLAGFEQPSAGKVLIDGQDVTELPPYQRPVNMMFQSYAVFPHMTVEKNVAYGLRKEGIGKREAARQVGRMLSLVQLSGYEKRKPHQLSGGQLQRVALARALVKKPKVLLLDEPLAALDRKLRERTQFELMNIQDELGITFVVVTHDQDEAMTLASRVAVMHEGAFVQIGTPDEVYEYPCNRFVADFFGATNMIEGVVAHRDGEQMCIDAPDCGALKAQPLPGAAPGDRVWVAVRPEKVAISKEPAASATGACLQGRVCDLGYFGKHSIYRVKIGTSTVIQSHVQNSMRTARRSLDWQDEVYVSWRRSSSIVLTE